MRLRFLEFVIGMIVAVAACLAFAQSQSSSNSVSKQGQSSSSASASARAGGSQRGSASGGGMSMGMPTPTHAIIYETGPNWVEGKSLKEQDLRDHGKYLADLTAKGVVILGGPWRYENGGLVVIRVKTDQEAQRMLDEDPGVKNGVLSGSVHAWEVLFKGSGVPMVKPPAGG
jgi:uncharacterized protein YciI